jgi:predicted Zn-dependent peptidase
MKRKFLLTIFLSLSCTLYNIAQTEIEFEEYDLENGLHVILHQDNSTPIVAVTVFYHVGSKNELADRTGFAHFFEHLMFEGSENIGRGEYTRLVQNAGGELNATTDFDRTFYYQVLPSNQLELGLWLESERMLHLKVDSIAVETQREVVKEERRLRLDNQPYGTIWEETFKRAYNKHPYQWMPIGSAQYIDQATLDEFMEFYQTYYVPENAILSIAGDINIDNTKELIEKYFSEIPEGSKNILRPQIVEPKQIAEVKDTVYDNIQLPAVVQAYHIPALNNEEYYAINMLTTLLATGQSSRLYKSLVDKQQKAAYVGAFPAGLEDPGLFIALGISNVGITANDLEESINAEIKKVRDQLISEEEFQKLRNQVESQYINQLSSVAGIAEYLAYYHNYFNDTELINTEIEKYMEVTREDIWEAANKYLTSDNRVVLYYLPISEQKTEGGK